MGKGRVRGGREVRDCMAEKLKLTIAIERYDRHLPFYDGTVPVPDGIGVCDGS